MTELENKKKTGDRYRQLEQSNSQLEKLRSYVQATI
jgi:hypothetical protein